MKRSEFEDKLVERTRRRREGCYAGEWMMVDRSDLRELLEEAGVPWDPEEPEAAKIIFYGHRDSAAPFATLLTENAHGGSRALTEAEKKEAAARYNAVGRLMTMEAFRAGAVPGDILHNILDDERRRLR